MENNIIVESDARKIFVKGKSSGTFVCDKVEIQLRFFAESPIAAKASESVAKQCEKFLQRASKSGIDISMIRLLDDSISQNSYRDDDYVRATRTLKFDADAAVSIINLILAIIQEEHIDATVTTDYYLSNEKEIRRELKAKALEDSREIAELLAASAGERIDGIYSVDMNERDSTYYMSKSLAVSADGFSDINELLSSRLSLPTELVEEEIEVTWLLADKAQNA